MKSAMGARTKRIREEFDEALGLQITVEEGVQFWALGAETCAKVLARPHRIGFLIRTRDGRYTQKGNVINAAIGRHR
jgi:hypothetical protein